MKLEFGPSSSVGFMDVQTLTSLLMAYVLPAMAATLVAVKVVKPFVEKQVEQRKFARSMGESKDKHWLYGHLQKYPLSTYEGLLKMLEKMKEFPAIFPYWIGPFRLTLTVHHPDVAKTILSRSSPKAEGYSFFLAPFLRSGLIVSHGDLWKRHRRLLTPIFHFNILKEHCAVFNNNCEAVISWCEEAADSGEVADIGDFMSDTSYMNMMECMMSQKVKSVRDEDYNQLVTQASALIFERWFSPWLWNNFLYRRSNSGKRFFRIVNKVHTKVGKIIKERRELLTSLGSDAVDTTEVDDKATGKSFIFRKMKGKNVDFLDVLLQTKDSDGVGLTDQEIIDEVATFFSAGQETVGNGLAWTLYYLSENLECQQKCRDEINEVLGNKTEVEIADMNKLRYLTQCIKEGLRLKPAIHVVGRTMDEDLTVSHRYNGHEEIKLKRGQIVMVNFFLIHRHPDLWSNPMVFDPDRFDPERSTERQSFSFLPFSAGPRNCIGQHFSMHQMRVVIAQLLRRFEVYRDSDTEPPKPVPGVSLHSANGVLVKIRKVA